MVGVGPVVPTGVDAGGAGGVVLAGGGTTGVDAGVDGVVMA